MNEMITEPSTLSASLDQVSMSWLIVTAAALLLFSLVLAWIATLAIYGRVQILKNIFPSIHNIIHAHVDYLIMTALLGVIYFFCKELALVLPASIIVTLCIGTIINPFGFILKAINPQTGQSDSIIGRVFICGVFIPATIGFG